MWKACRWQKTQWAVGILSGPVWLSWSEAVSTPGPERGQQSPDPGRLWYLIKVFIPQTGSHSRVPGRGMAWPRMHFRPVSWVAFWAMNWRGKLCCLWLHPPSVNKAQLSSRAYGYHSVATSNLERTTAHYHEGCGEVVSWVQKKSLPSLPSWALHSRTERQGWTAFFAQI